MSSSSVTPIPPSPLLAVPFPDGWATSPAARQSGRSGGGACGPTDAGWLDVRAAAGAEIFTDAGTRCGSPPSHLRMCLAPAWLLLLCGDASPTLVLSLVCGAPLAVTVLGAEELCCGGDGLNDAVTEGVPVEGLSVLAAPRLRRRVLLTVGGAVVGYAVSWFGAGSAASLLGTADAREPIGRALVSGCRETRRELLAVSRAPAHAELDAAFGIDRSLHDTQFAGDLWGRWYLIYADGRPLCLVHEVFSPRLQELGLGPQSPLPSKPSVN